MCKCFEEIKTVWGLGKLAIVFFSAKSSGCEEEFRKSKGLLEQKEFAFACSICFFLIYEMIWNSV